MTGDKFCDQYVEDMLNQVNTFDANYNISYSGNIFYSYKMPICQHFMIGFLHYFEIIDEEESPSIATTKHINKLVKAISEYSIKHKNPNVSITYVREIVKREKRNELD